MKLFVPGRLCLFGEHSDWAGGYRTVNPSLGRGYTLIVSTNQGIYADVKLHPTHLILKTTLNDDTKLGPVRLPMEKSVLLAAAEAGDFFSYAAGVAYYVLTNYQVKGLEIDNYLTDLPIKKGLSSSAAICVLVARAFNRLYNLKMTLRGEMEVAYQGEILTPSQCGRMDQGCAYGNQPILMSFDGAKTDVIELKVPKDLFVVIVDLGADKNTSEILRDLNQGYPIATNEIQANVQHYLSVISSQITQEAVTALQQGDAEKLGQLMTLAQQQFDQLLTPASPAQLTAPKLHHLLHYSPLQPYIWGGKGVGSQGDGAAQFIAKNAESQAKVIEIIERDFPQMQCLKLTLRPQALVRKAVIPAAGFGTRMFPTTQVVKKELFPIIDQDGRAKPVILAIVEEALKAGVEEIGIVVQKSDIEVFEALFKQPPSPEIFQKLSPINQEYSQYLQKIGEHITFLIQDTQDGFGHAVFCAKNWVNHEPFLLLLGDHIYISTLESSCSRQLVEVYSQVRQSVIGLQMSPVEVIHHYGCATGIWQEKNSILTLTKLAEKPKADYARQHLQVEGMPEDVFLSVFGMYILEPNIFEYLAEHIEQNLREKGEFQLTSCLDRLRETNGLSGYLVKGKSFDTGQPQVYRQTLIDFPLSGSTNSRSLEH